MKALFTRVTAMAASVLLLASFNSCGTSGENNSKTESNAAKTESGGSVSLRISCIESPSEVSIVNEIIAGFTAENPGVQVVYEPIAGGDTTGRLLAQASAGQLPDVFMSLDSLVANFAKKKVTLDLTSYLAENKVNVDDIYPSMLELGKYNGELHLVPREYSKVVTYYNKEVFQAAGVAFPKNGWTWDEFVATNRKLVQKSGDKITMYGTQCQFNWSPTMIPMLIGLGGSVFNEDGTSCIVNNAATAAAFTQLKALADEGVLVNTFKAGLPNFTSGKVAMYFSVRAGTSDVIAALGEDKWDVVTFPKMPNKVVVGSGTCGYSVAATTNYPELAAKLALYVIGDSGQKALMETGNAIPVLKSLANSTVWRQEPNTTINQDAYVLNPEADILPITSMIQDVAKGSKVSDAFNRMVESILTGNESVEAGLKSGQNNVNAVLF